MVAPKVTTGTVGATKAGGRLSASDWVQLLSAFGPAALSAIGGAGQASYDRKRQEQQDLLERAQADYLRRQGARAGLSSFYADQLAQQRSGAQALANAMPLGAEQDLATRMALLRGLSAAGQAGPTVETSGNPALQARLAAQPTRNVLAGWARPDVVQAISPEATARSIAERRKALAGLDPNFQFGGMGDYGVPDLGGEVSGYASSVQGRRAQAEGTLLNYLQQQMNEAQAPLVPQAQTMQAGTTGQTGEKKTPWWKRALKVAAAAAPIVAAPFTSGATLALIGAGSGALAGGLDGGMQGALTGGALGAATAGLGGGAAGSAAKRQIGESVRSAVQRSILNPRALAQLAGAGIGGQTGQTLQMASTMLPGAREYQSGFRNTLRQAGIPESQIPGTAGYRPDIVAPAGERDALMAQASRILDLPSVQNQNFAPMPTAAAPALERAATASYGPAPGAQGRRPAPPKPWTPTTQLDEAWGKATGISAPPQRQPSPGVMGRMGDAASAMGSFFAQNPALASSPLGVAAMPFVGADAALGTGIMDRINKGMSQLGETEFMQTLRNQPLLRVLQSPQGALMTGGILSAIPGAAAAAGAAGEGRGIAGLLPSGPPPVIPRGPSMLGPGPSPAGLLPSGPPPIASASRMLGPGAPGGALARTPGTALARQPGAPAPALPPGMQQQMQQLQAMLQNPAISDITKQRLLMNPTVQGMLQQYRYFLNWM